ncbi:MAG TPA: hypothetical protein DCG23_00995, partial [Deltaproteobacteria bacterium]|nr:hypothetical protein [Deltaproteobacteria bacterium]
AAGGAAGGTAAGAAALTATGIGAIIAAAILLVLGIVAIVMMFTRPPKCEYIDSNIMNYCRLCSPCGGSYLVDDSVVEASFYTTHSGTTLCAQLSGLGSKAYCSLTGRDPYADNWIETYSPSSEKSILNCKNLVVPSLAQNNNWGPEIQSRLDCGDVNGQYRITYRQNGTDGCFSDFYTPSYSPLDERCCGNPLTCIQDDCADIASTEITGTYSYRA